jgi:flagellum-specific peptidoglycan hydrolase FlgJ
MKEWIRDITIILAVFILGLFVGLKSQYYNKESKSIQHNEYETNDSSITENLKYYFTKHKIKFSHIVLAQAKLESNNFKSDIFKKNLNCFGMFVAAQRFTFAENNYDFSNYAKYSSLENCVLDYCSWQRSNAYNIYNDDQYFELLEKIYAKDKNYVTTLKKIITQNKKN